MFRGCLSEQATKELASMDVTNQSKFDLAHINGSRQSVALLESSERPANESERDSVSNESLKQSSLIELIEPGQLNLAMALKLLIKL